MAGSGPAMTGVASEPKRQRLAVAIGPGSGSSGVPDLPATNPLARSYHKTINLQTNPVASEGPAFEPVKSPPALRLRAHGAGVGRDRPRPGRPPRPDRRPV